MPAVGSPGRPASTHWQSWHDSYGDPTSSLSRRLEVVRGELADSLDETPPGPIRILSLCAGDGRDVLGVLGRHSRGQHVTATLVELDGGLAERARESAAAIGVGSVVVVEADAGEPSGYVDRVAAFDVVMCCGVFGNISADDVSTTITGIASLVASGGSVVWTRHRAAPDATPTIRGLFGDAGFEEVTFTTIEASLAAVGRARRRGTPIARPSGRWFDFSGDGSGAHR